MGMVLAAPGHTLPGALAMADSNRPLKEEAAERAHRGPALWAYVKAHPLGIAIGVAAGLAIGALCGIAAGPGGSVFGALIGAVVGVLAAGGMNTAAGGRVTPPPGQVDPPAPEPADRR